MSHWKTAADWTLLTAGVNWVVVTMTLIRLTDPVIYDVSLRWRNSVPYYGTVVSRVHVYRARFD